MQGDRLHEIFQLMLGQTHDLEETARSLIRRVAAAYSVELMSRGEIPLAFIDDVLNDLEAETLEIYRKTTYGALSLREYRQGKLIRGPKPRSK